MAIHSKQGRRSGGGKKNSRRGYGKVAGAASSGAGSQQANAARTAKQGPRGGGTKSGFVKAMDDWRRQSPIHGIAAGVMGKDKIANLKAQNEAHSKGAQQWANWKPPEDKMLTFGYKDIGYNSKLTDSLKQLPQVTKIANYNAFNRSDPKSAIDNLILDIDDNLRGKLRSGITGGGLVPPRIVKKTDAESVAEPDPESVAKKDTKAKPAPESVAQAEPGGMMQVPPEKPAEDLDKEMPTVPADAAKKGAEVAAKKKPKPRPTTWANGTPVGSGTDKSIIHPDSLQARGGGGSTQKNPIAEQDKSNTQLAKGTPARKKPTFSSDTGGGRRSSNVTYDYSALDEARDKYAKAEATKGAAAQAAFEGDIGKTMAAGHAIRSLQQQARAAEMQGPRIRQKQSSFTAPNREFSIG